MGKKSIQGYCFVFFSTSTLLYLVAPDRIFLELAVDRLVAGLTAEQTVHWLFFVLELADVQSHALFCHILTLKKCKRHILKCLPFHHQQL